MISYTNHIKVVADFLGALLLLSVLSPILIVLTLGLYIANNGSPFFFQLRPGKNEKIFRIIKFKTMTDERDAQGKLLPDAKRLTRLGKWVRNASLDELPQLFNVLKGDMSFVGPRPLLPEYLPLYNKNQARRHEVRPGITGWAQVNGRNAISWEEKFNFDVWYVENVSISLDLKIILMTVSKVIKSDGINARNQATVKNFEGNE